MKRLFGTDGIRGHAGEFPLDAATVMLIGRSLAKQFRDRLGREPRFITGRDTRESGPSIEAALHRGIEVEAGTAESAGVITTPGVAYVTGKFVFDAGIVISASHNPFADNGMKIFSPDGKKVGEDIERAIEAEIQQAADTDASPPFAALDSARVTEFRRAYLEHLESEGSQDGLNGLRIVVDCANGAASDLAPDLFRRLGADVVAINDRPDGRNINENCGSLFLDALRDRVAAEKAALGVAYDGDADRALFVDEKGVIVDGDATLWIMSRYLRDTGGLANSTVVATVMSNIGLEIALASEGIKLVRTPVGDKYVLDELLRSGSELGGEQSGHLIFPRKSVVGDGMMTTLFLLTAMRSAGRTLSEMVMGFTRYPQVLVNVKVREKRPFDDVEEISRAAHQIERQLDGSGRLLLRYSGTENLARVMIEGKAQAEIERQANELAEVIRAVLG